MELINRAVGTGGCPSPSSVTEVLLTRPVQLLGVPSRRSGRSGIGIHLCGVFDSWHQWQWILRSCGA